MRYTTLFTTVIVIAGCMSVFSADSQYERELRQLADQRDKALAGAIEPINKRYQTALEQLLKRATQANALDDAIKIREALALLAAQDATGANSRTPNRQTLQRKLPGTQWIGDGKNYVGELEFHPKGVKWTKTGGGATALVSYEVANDGSVHFKIGTNDTVLTISADFKSLTLDGSTFTRK